MISRGQVSGVRGRGGCYLLFRNPAEVACLREARSWRFIIKTKIKHWTKQNTNVGQMPPTNLSLAASELFIKLQKCELHRGRIFVLFALYPQAQYQGQSKHSINIEVKSGGQLADILIPSVCIIPLNFHCGFMLLITDFG